MNDELNEQQATTEQVSVELQENEDNQENSSGKAESPEAIYEAALKDVVADKLSSLAPEVVEMAPTNLSVVDQLEWIKKAEVLQKKLDESHKEEQKIISIGRPTPVHDHFSAENPTKISPQNKIANGLADYIKK